MGVRVMRFSGEVGFHLDLSAHERLKLYVFVDVCFREQPAIRFYSFQPLRVLNSTSIHD